MVRKIRLDHIGIAVSNLDAGTNFWRILGLNVLGDDESNAEQGVNIRFMDTSSGEAPKLELLEPTGDDTPIGKFIAKRGEGVQQLAFEVEDLDSLLKELSAKGVALINETPQDGASGTRIAFVHPKSTGGVLVELLERV